MGERMRGRAGQAALARRRSQHPFCAHCEARGLTRAAVEMDHVIPLALGGDDVDDNIQGLCVPCHAIKTAFENASEGGAANHPDWLRPAKCKLTIVSGPPCSGKSSLVERERGGLDLVIDLDDIAERLSPGFYPRRRWTGELMNQAIRARNALLGALSQMPPNSQAWFIVSCPTLAEQDWWKGKLKPANIVRLMPPMKSCMDVASRTRDVHAVKGVVGWFERRGRRWSPKKPTPKRVACGADGYPIEEEKA